MNKIYKIISCLKEKPLRRGFTLIEILVVVITLGALASLALSNYNKVVERSHCQNAQKNLVLMHSAFRIKMIKNQTLYASAANLTDINTKLGLSIPADPYFDYDWGNDVYDAVAKAQRKDGPAYNCTLSFKNPLKNTNPQCGNAQYCTPIIDP